MRIPGGGGAVESTVKAAAVPQCRPAPYLAQSCNTAKCERREGRGGEGWGYRTVVTSPSGGRQQEMRIIAVAASGSALLV